MIKRSLIVCIAVILCWHFLMPRLGRSFHAIPGMQRSNYSHAQHYIHEMPADTKVLVGSSMSDRLSVGLLGKDHAKLTFPGGGPLTGLEIIHATGRKPQVLWIEINVILRAAEEDLLADVLSPWRREIRERSDIFVEKGRPSAYGVGFLKAVVKKVTKGETPPTAELDSSVMDGMMAANIEHHSKVPDPAKLAAAVSRMGTIADELAAAGCKVVFYEMPISPELSGLAEPAAVRKAVKERFPDGKYRWLDLSRELPYQTTDGVHLTAEDADSVVRRMLEFEKTLK